MNLIARQVYIYIYIIFATHEYVIRELINARFNVAVNRKRIRNYKFDNDSTMMTT